MINIGDLLNGYSKIKNPADEKKFVCRELCSRFGLSIKEEDLLFRKNVAIFRVNSIQKNFIFLRREEFLKVLKEIVPERYIDTIHF